MIANARLTDAQARVELPENLANTAVIVEQVNESEIRIRKVEVEPADETWFLEEEPIVLTDSERDRFLDLLDNPPGPSSALVRAFARRAPRND